MMNEYLISPDSSLQDALEQLDSTKGVGLIVANREKKLLGTLTDGDIRRALLKGNSLGIPVSKVMHIKPTVGNKSTSKEELEKITKDKFIKLVPIVRGEKIIDVHVADLEETSEIPVVLMAGGLGSRLGEHTKDCPKPMLEVGGRPVLEIAIENFTRVGFSKFFLSVNYKAEMIEDYFKAGEKHDSKITYIREKKRLGTAGSLSLLPKELKGPVVVTNGDLLTLVDYRRLISFHNHHQSSLTMCTRKYDLQVPFGVVNVKDGFALEIDEKPVHSFNVSAGLYVIDSTLLKHIPQDEYYDMPTFLEKLMSMNVKVHCFPMFEQWIDIGRVSDLDYARSIYRKHE